MNYIRPHNTTCACTNCQTERSQFINRHLSWRERKLLRLAPTRNHATATAPCGCRQCSSGSPAPIYTPTVYLVARANYRLPAGTPGYWGEMEGEQAVRKESPSSVMSSYLYVPHTGRCTRPKPKASEQFVQQYYRQQLGKSNVQRGNQLITVPDLVLSKNIGSLDQMRLKMEAELEFVEVKNYDVKNKYNLAQKLKQQIQARRNVTVSTGARGNRQLVVLDFRGQENHCEEIKKTVDYVANALKTGTRGVEILIQVLLWKNCAETHACRLRGKTH